MKMGKIKMGRGAAAVSGQPDRFCRKLQLSDDIIKSSQQVSRVSKKLNHEKQTKCFNDFLFLLHKEKVTA